MNVQLCFYFSGDFVFNYHHLEMIQVAKRGKLIVLEGLDRSGKSSTVRAILDLLSQKKLPTVEMKFPDRESAIGRLINDYLNNKTNTPDETIHLLFSANRWQNIAKMESYLSQGINIVCDRYWYSGVAYSTAKGLDYEWCAAPDKGLIQPDVVIYLRADPQYLKKRANYGEEKYEKVQFQKKVFAVFEKMFTQNEKKRINVIQVGEKGMEEVKQEARNIVISLFNER